jgi:hypothetical protein
VLTIDAARRVLATDPGAADALLHRAAASVEGTVADVRRVVYALRPPALDQLGLIGALRQQAATLGPGDPQLEIDIDAPEPMPPLGAAVEVAAYPIAQEALTNVARHARARHAAITITVGDVLALTIADDGCGLSEHHLNGVGLTSMRERATELRGTSAISRPANGGTLLAVRCTVRSPAGGSAAPDRSPNSRVSSSPCSAPTSPSVSRSASCGTSSRRLRERPTVSHSLRGHGSGSATSALRVLAALRRSRGLRSRFLRRRPRGRTRHRWSHGCEGGRRTVRNPIPERPRRPLALPIRARQRSFSA